MARSSSFTLVDSPLPKSASGRRAAELNQELAEALVTALTESAVIAGENGDDPRPRALGPSEGFDTHGKAGAAGRRYALHVGNTLGKKVRVNVYGESRNDKGEWTGPFHWRIYIPLADSE